jgi:hypothetical protein
LGRVLTGGVEEPIRLGAGMGAEDKPLVWAWAWRRWSGRGGGQTPLGNWRRRPPGGTEEDGHRRGALARGGGRELPWVPEVVAGITEGRWRCGAPPVDGVAEQRWWAHDLGAVAAGARVIGR